VGESLESKNKRKGMSLVEAIVAVTVFVTASSLAASFITYGYRNHLKVTEEALATDRVNISIQKLAEELRKTRTGENAGFPIITAQEDEIAFYSDSDNDGKAEKIRYFLSNEVFYRGVTEPTGAPPVYLVANEVVKKITDKIVWEEGSPLFNYHGIDPLGGGVNEVLSFPVDVSRVRLVEITLKTPVGKEEKIRTVSTQVLLRNLKDY
jgi:type II secretory pathway pseudopilin PulG